MIKSKGHSDKMAIKGFFRVQITEDGKGVVGDSGWKENKVTDNGINLYLVKWLTDGSGGQKVGFMALGTGGAPVASSVQLDGEITGTASGGAGSARVAVSSSVTDLTTAIFTGAFASSNSFVTKTETIANIGLFNSAATGSGTLFAGNTFVASSCAVNQSVNATYQIRFASTT